MKRLKAIKELNQELSSMPSASIDEKKLINAFERLKKDIGIEKEISILDSYYLQPFKLEYIGTGGGLKNYMLNLDTQKIGKGDEYCKLVVKKDKKLVVVKSFGKISKLNNNTLDKLLLLVRLSQYISKNRELYALEISMLQLLVNK